MNFFRQLDARNPNDPSEPTRWTVSEDAPKWVSTAVRDAHDGDLPRDWIYGIARHFFYECNDPNDEDFVSGFADRHVDIYTARLARWYADNCLSAVFANAESEAEDCESFGTKRGINDYLRAVQYHAVRSIAVRLSWHMRRAMRSDES